MTLRIILAVSCLGAMALTGCTQTSKALGLRKNAPNEFNILTKAPLIVPPEYNLRPPQVGTSSAENNYTQKAAREASRGEVILMSKAGVGRANQEIRLEIDGQNSVERKTEGFSDRVLFWRDGGVVNPDGSPLDNEIEAKRLESVKSATGGGEVTITKRPGGAKLPGL